MTQTRSTSSSASFRDRPDVEDRRFQEAARRPGLVRVLVWFLCHALAAYANVCVSLCVAWRGRRRPAATKRPSRIVVTGAFVADNWAAALLQPMAMSPHCAHVWAVVDNAMAPLPNVTFVRPPRWLARRIGRVPARSLVFALTCLVRRADLIGGYHLLVNGLLALVIARILGAAAMYVSVGGWSEYLAGGAYSGHVLFGRLGREDPSLERAMLRMIRDFDLTAAMGRRACELLRRQGVARVAVLPGGIDATRFSRELEESAKEIDVVVVARLDAVKRLDVFLRVVAEAAQRVPSIRAAIVGDGPCRHELQRLAAELGVSNRVVFAGFQPDIAPWLGRARVFLLTSASEGLPLSVLEAMTFGLPVVVSDVGELRDCVRDGLNGCRVPAGDVSAYAHSVASLLLDEPKRRRWASESVRIAREYDVQTISARWSRVLTDLGFPAGRRLPALNWDRFRNAGANAWVLPWNDGLVPDRPSTELLFLGDVALAAGVADVIRRHGVGYPFERLPAGFLDADHICFNLECCLSERGAPWEPKPIHFRGNAAYLDLFTSARGRLIANVANNHFLDYGEEAALDTLAALRDRGMACIGAVGEAAEPQPLVLDTPAGRIGLLAFSPAAHGLPGSVRVNVARAGTDAMIAQVAAARGAVDVLVVCLHQGVEYTLHVDRRSRMTARRLVDAGADCVIGHHAHVIQPIERWGRGLICHGIGNFLIDVDPRRRPHAARTLAVRMILRDGAVERVRLEPFEITPSLQPVPLEGEARTALARSLAVRSQRLAGSIGSIRNDAGAGIAWALDKSKAAVDMSRRRGLMTAVRYYGRRVMSRPG